MRFVRETKSCFLPIRNSFLPRRIRNWYEKNFHAYMFNYNFPTIPYFRRNVDVLNRKRNLTITRYATLKLLRVSVTTILFQVLKRIIFDLVPETWFFWIFFFLFNELRNLLKFKEFIYSFCDESKSSKNYNRANYRKNNLFM